MSAEEKIFSWFKFAYVILFGIAIFFNIVRRNKHNFSIFEKKINDLEGWKKYMLDSTNQAIISTGLFIHNIKFINKPTIAMFDLENKNELTWILENMEVIKKFDFNGTGTESKIDNISKYSEEDERLLSQDCKLINYISEKSEQKVEIYEKIFCKLDLEKLRTDERLKKHVNLIKRPDKVLFFELFYMGKKQEDSGTHAYTLSLSSVTEKVK